MTAGQLTLGGWDPAWDLAAEADDDPGDSIDPRWRDLRGQGLTAAQLERIHTLDLHGSYL
ncbi:hypothetical protein HZZ00_11015 [Streptomyces sp. NEAU-sy36]|uniref:hypothetical protein n=1 Tax=unclassified Streptomyces TaxID=2593676 RepID=UPI0015D63672|nr:MULTISPECIES: hypothetical protein [unclassified Streptomyces]QLJ01501.1 hypothetical protein HZZ00_11015 [Streptomyces sp. NEAU-sy36]